MSALSSCDTEGEAGFTALVKVTGRPLRACRRAASLSGVLPGERRALLEGGYIAGRSN